MTRLDAPGWGTKLVWLVVVVVVAAGAWWWLTHRAPATVAASRPGAGQAGALPQLVACRERCLEVRTECLSQARDQSGATNEAFRCTTNHDTCMNRCER